MNEKEALLQQLRDIHAPLAPGFWPPAIGWWILLLVLVLLLVGGIYRLRKYLQSRRYRKQALRLLKQIEATRNAQAPAQTMQQLLILLKRTAFTAYRHSRNTIANLYGHDFFVFLELCLKNPRHTVDSKWHNALYQQPLLEHPAFPLTHFLDFARDWIDNHEKLPAEELQRRLHAQQAKNQAPAIGATHG